MELNLTAVRTKGRKEKIPIVLAQSPLTSDDFETHNTEGVSKYSTLTRLTARHRKLASLLASGLSTGEAAAAVNLTPSYVSILKNDPTFQGLIRYFETQVDNAGELFRGAAEMLSLEAIATLTERIQETPDELDATELTRIVAVAADRAGFAPKRVEEKTVNVNFGDRLEAARVRAKTMRDVTPSQIEAAE